MSGGGGGIIIRSAAKTTLAYPIIRGQLPVWMQTATADALSKDVGDWSESDCHHAGIAFYYAITHCH